MQITAKVISLGEYKGSSSSIIAVESPMSQRIDPYLNVRFGPSDIRRCDLLKQQGLRRFATALTSVVIRRVTAGVSPSYSYP
jgi:hypothetical protein